MYIWKIVANEKAISLLRDLVYHSDKGIHTI